MSDESGTILVIDGSTSELSFVRRSLEPLGYRVVPRTMAFGSSAIVLREKPDIVLVDPSLPGMAGQDLAEMMRTLPGRDRFLVVLYSSLDLDTLRATVTRMDAEGYLEKSTDPGELARGIETFMRKRRLSSTRLLSSGAPRQSARAEGDPLRVLFIDDDRSILRSYRQSLGREIDADYVSSTSEALGMILSDAPPHLVVCDVVLPGMSGAELYERAVSADVSWKRRFIFVTGAATTSSVARFIHEGNIRILHKPITSDRLLEAIRSLEQGMSRRTSRM